MENKKEEREEKRKRKLECQTRASNIHLKEISERQQTEHRGEEMVKDKTQKILSE